MESEEINAKLIEKPNGVKLILEQDSVSKIIHLTEQDACNMYFWVNGVKESGLVTPVEFRIAGIDYWWDYEVWSPVWDVLHPWYENYLDKMSDELE